MEVCTTCGNPMEDGATECRHCRELKLEEMPRRRSLADREDRDKREKDQRQRDMEFEPVTQLDAERKKIITISVIVAAVAIVLAGIAMVVMGSKTVDAAPLPTSEQVVFVETEENHQEVLEESTT